ncbi:MAG: helix-turn-helix transcriptional regulator [Tatlockia sp.]|nr:helix-turn-helix transcriptional regulator [Tatlockia sp.]
MAPINTSSHPFKMAKSLIALTDSILYKDLNSYYLGCNDAFAEIAGLTSVKDAIGKNDLMLPWHKSSQMFISNDRLVTKHKKSLYFIEPTLSAKNKLIDLLTIKAPLFGKVNSIIGIKGISIPIENPSFDCLLKKFINGAQQFHLKLDPLEVIQIITQIIQVNNCKQQWKKNCELFDYGKVKFTLREAQCLHYFFNHYSAEKTSKELFISKKTVESHLAKIKKKLNCINSIQLTNLAIDYGFINLMFMQF